MKTKLNYWYNTITFQIILATLLLLPVMLQADNGIGKDNNKYKEYYSTSSAAVKFIEYSIDEDPGYGKGTKVYASGSTDVTLNFNINIAGLTKGIHHLFFRPKDANGIWGNTTHRIFYFDEINPDLPNLSKLYYAIDEEIANNAFHSIPFIQNKDVSVSYRINLPNLSTGLHTLLIFSIDAYGRKSNVRCRIFYFDKLSTDTPNVTHLYYSLDDEIAEGIKHSIPFTSGNDITANYVVELSNLTEGLHYLFIYAKDSNGKISPVRSKAFYVEGEGTTQITLLSPNGGENWEAVTTHNINWISVNVDNVKIEFSSDNGANWASIVDNVVASETNYSWVLPDINSNQCKVKISDVSNSSVNDESDAIFSIIKTGTFTITANTPEPNDPNQRPAWVSTDINVSQGDTLIITALGQVNDGGGYIADPNGTGVGGDPNPSLPDWFDNVSHISLIGRIKVAENSYIALDDNIDISGSGIYGPGFVGTSFNSIIEYAGTIQLSINDGDSFNNSGSFHVSVEVKSNKNPNGIFDLPIPTSFSLSQNYPNPFNPETVIKYDVPKTSYITLKVYDILGREVVTLVDEVKQTGVYQATFSANSSLLASGIYFCQMVTDGFVETKKTILMK